MIFSTFGGMPNNNAVVLNHETEDFICEWRIATERNKFYAIFRKSQVKSADVAEN